MLRQPVTCMPGAVQPRSCPLDNSVAAGTRAAARSRMAVVQRRPPPGLRCSANAAQAADKTSVLFVCLGNICRSPTAEAVFKSVVERAGKADRFDIDSCGTGGGNPSWYEQNGWSYHEGNPSDPRMQQAAQKRGISLTSLSRPLKPADLERFDHIIGMDDENLLAIRTAAEYWRSYHPDIPRDYDKKVKLMTQYVRDVKFAEFVKIPDPYFGGAKGFELVLDLLEDAAEGLLADIDSS